MTTDYDRIAREYQASKRQPWRTHVERHTLLEMLGDIRGLAALDLACGEGYYTRLLREREAQPVAGVDLSHGMIELALAQEAAQPLGISYEVADARDFDRGSCHDLVFAAYLLNYAEDYDQLLAMCTAIHRNLKPGGRFVTVNNRPDDPPENFDTGRQYGYSKRRDPSRPLPLRDGDPVIWTFHLPNGSTDVTNYYLAEATVERALLAAGLRDIRWRSPCVSPEGIRDWGDAYWRPLLDCPPIAFLECRR